MISTINLDLLFGTICLGLLFVSVMVATHHFSKKRKTEHELEHLKGIVSHQESSLPEAKFYERACMWKKELKKYGLESDFDDLVMWAEKNVLETTQIPYLAVFTNEEYLSLLKRLTGDRFEHLKSYGTGGFFEMDTLASAFHVKQLLQYSDKLNESISILEEKESVSKLSDEALLKLNSMRVEIWEIEMEKNRYVYLKPLSDVSQKVTFKKFAIMEEEDLMDIVFENLKGGKPVIRKANQFDESVVTSPALLEINDFLNENKLPEDVYQELQDTMNRIKTKLLNDQRQEVDESLRRQAEVLNTSSKDYHKIS